MKQAILWGFIFGLVAFVGNILLPGCIEPFFDMLAAFAAAGLAVRQSHTERRGSGMRLGLVAGLVSGIVITITDVLTAGLLAAGYVYKDKLPWINLPDLSYLNSILGNTLLVFVVVFLCLGIIKIGVVFIGGAAGGAIFSSAHNRTKTD